MNAVTRVEVFGGVRVGVAGGEVPVRSVRASVLVAALVLARGALVTSAELKSLMWPSGEPATAANQLHRLVGQVRRLFEPELSPRDAGVFVTGSSGGYRLEPGRVHSDLDDCDAAVERARRLIKEELWDLATQQYLLALEVISHPLLGDMALEGAGHPTFSAVAHTRVALAVEALDCARRSGRLEHVVALVEQIAAPLPFEESLQAELIRALAQVGRRRDAMTLYDEVRTTLVEELGVDPGPELRTAHAELLRIGGGEPGLATADDPTGSGPAPRPVQLPAAPRGLTARPEAQAVLDRVAGPGETGAVVITSIGGMGGIGKTTLAVAWARSLAPRFPDGQLYVNLRGFDPAGEVMTSMDALRQLLLSLGVPAVNGEESLEMRAARFRSVVADRRLLVLLDNARDAEQVRPLLPASEGCLVIVTSRNQLPSLVVREGAVTVRLDRMNDEQARELLTRRLGLVRLALEPAAVERIISAAAGLPLALAIVAARLAVDPELGLAAVADELTASAGPGGTGPHLTGWSAGEANEDLATVFDWSYELLDARTAGFFRLLAVHPGPELSLPAMAGITGNDVPTTRQLALRLVGASLLERRSHDRFVIHDLLREYARSRLLDPEWRRAEARLVGHYVRSTRNAWSVFGRAPVGELDPVTELAGLEPETFEGLGDATEWYVRERAVLPVVLRLASARGWDRAAANIAIDWRPMNQAVDVDADTYPHALAALAAAERTGDPVLRAELHRDVGPKAVRLGDVEAGRKHLEEARALYALVGDIGGEANTLRNLATVPTVPRVTKLAHLRDAIALVQQGDAPQILQLLQAHLAACIMDVGRHDPVSREECLEAERLLSGCMPVMLAEGWTYLIPVAANTLSEVLLRLSRPREALDVAYDALRFAQSDPVDVALLHVRVAEAALAAGERAIAAQACRDFHALLDLHGRDHIDEMLAQAMSAKADKDPFAPIEDVEAALAMEPPGQEAEPTPGGSAWP